MVSRVCMHGSCTTDNCLIGRLRVFVQKGCFAASRYDSAGGVSGTRVRAMCGFMSVVESGGVVSDHRVRCQTVGRYSGVYSREVSCSSVLRDGG